MLLRITIGGLISLICCFIFTGCGEKHSTTASVYHYIKPQYDLVQIQATNDTVHFPLDDSTYNSITSFNIFSQGDKEFISFFDQDTKVISVFRFPSKEPVAKISVEKFFLGHNLYAPSVYIINFDSIIVGNKATVYLFDSSGRKKRGINFLDDPKFAWGFVANSSPPVIKENLLYVGVRPNVDPTSKRALRNWKTMYGFDLKKKEAQLYYNLPELYKKNLFGYHFLNYNYCYNNRGNFVFSFAADSIIYETNLADYHAAYLGKSKLQHGVIQPANKEIVSDDKEVYHQYLLKDSYGPIYFDPCAKRYLRIARSRISKADYDAKKWKKEHRIIIFDEQFRIIGESPIDRNIAAYTLFFTKDGSIYARTNLKDEYAIHYVKLAYVEKPKEPLELTKNGKQ